MEPTTGIKNFFKDQTVFLTGGTGFLGKVLLEKLLRECVDLRKIYMLMRPKKGKTSKERLDDLFSNPCFDVIKTVGINFAEKVRLVIGDCEEPMLGLTPDDAEVLKKETTCVIHAAANVKFDQSIKEAIYHAIATKDLLEMAKGMKKLGAFVYVSTAYSNCVHTHIKEEFYEPPMKAEDLKALVKILDDETLVAITPHLIGKWPNTYVFIKCITENQVNIESENLPVVVIRPSIVTSSVKEPLPGWIDNMYGLVGVMVAVALGLIRSYHGNNDNKMNFVPVDYVCNFILAAAWEAGQAKSTIVYNYVGHRKNVITLKEYHDKLFNKYWDAPLTRSIWYPYLKIRENKICHEIAIFFLHMVPAWFIDAIFIIARKDPFAVKGYRRLHKLLDLLSYFTKTSWQFDDGNLRKLWEKMSPEDRKSFNFNMEDLDWDNYATSVTMGARLYLIKDQIDTIPKARQKLKLLFVVHYVVIAIFWYLLYKLLMFIVSFFT